MTALPAAELLAAQPPLLERPDALAEIRDRIGSHGRLLIIDDDPTGTQSVHGVPVLTAWSREDLAGALRDAGTVFVLTNSRSLPEREAIAISTEITERAVAIAADAGLELAVASRSDSTLRGHFPHEPEASPTRWAARSTACCSARAFLEAGRLTIDDVQWVAEDDQLVPSASTTYAEDRRLPVRTAPRSFASEALAPAPARRELRRLTTGTRSAQDQMDSAAGRRLRRAVG